MLPFDDQRWIEMKAGYRCLFDSRPLLIQLNSGRSTAATWQELWKELHHQGDVGEASYAAVPYLVKIYKESAIIDWNTYSIVAIIDLARGQGANPHVPDWLKPDYLQAIHELAEIGITQLSKTEDESVLLSILSIIAISKGLRTHGKFLVNYSEEELLEIESQI